MIARGHRMAVDAALLALLGLTGVAVAGDVPVLRPVTVLLALLLVPGAAVLTRLRVDDLATAAALAIGFSLALNVMLAAALARAHTWEPWVIAVAFGVPATILLAVDLYRATVDQRAAPG